MSEKTTKATKTTTPKVRVTYSRRKFGAAVKVLKGAISTETLPLQTKLRCIELLMILYDVELPDSSRRDQKAVRQLVSERTVERSLHADIRAEVAARVEAEAQKTAEEQAEQEKAQREVETANALKSFLSPVNRTEATDALGGLAAERI
jgi:hypothetical protein